MLLRTPRPKGFFKMTQYSAQRQQRAKQDGDGNRVRTRNVQEREKLQQEERLRRAQLKSTLEQVKKTMADMEEEARRKEKIKITKKQQVYLIYY
jgi:hypothetical protein